MLLLVCHYMCRGFMFVAPVLQQTRYATTHGCSYSFSNSALISDVVGTSSR